MQETYLVTSVVMRAYSGMARSYNGRLSNFGLLSCLEVFLFVGSHCRGLLGVGRMCSRSKSPFPVLMKK